MWKSYLHPNIASPPKGYRGSHCLTKKSCPKCSSTIITSLFVSWKSYKRHCFSIGASSKQVTLSASSNYILRKEDEYALCSVATWMLTIFSVHDWEMNSHLKSSRDYKTLASSETNFLPRRKENPGDFFWCNRFLRRLHHLIMIILCLDRIRQH